MAERGSYAPVLAVLLSTLGCRGTSERVVRDTEGRTFSVQCSDSGCTVARMSGSSVSAEKSGGALHAPGRVVTVCDVVPGSEPGTSSDCRALTCEHDTNCPAAHGASRGTCVNRLCIESRNDLTVDDAVVLCLAGTGLGRASSGQVGRYAMALNCGLPCKIPGPCLKP
jgi:hypothetical protein